MICDTILYPLNINTSPCCLIRKHKTNRCETHYQLITRFLFSYDSENNSQDLLPFPETFYRFYTPWSRGASKPGDSTKVTLKRVSLHISLFSGFHPLLQNFYEEILNFYLETVSLYPPSMFIQQNQIKFFGRGHVCIIDLCPLSDISCTVPRSQKHKSDDHLKMPIMLLRLP